MGINDFDIETFIALNQQLKRTEYAIASQEAKYFKENPPMWREGCYMLTKSPKFRMDEGEIYSLSVGMHHLDAVNGRPVVKYDVSVLEDYERNTIIHKVMTEDEIQDLANTGKYHYFPPEMNK